MKMSMPNEGGQVGLFIQPFFKILSFLGALILGGIKYLKILFIHYVKEA